MRSIVSRTMLQRASPEHRGLERPSRPLRAPQGEGNWLATRKCDERAGHPIACRAAHLGLARSADDRGGDYFQRRRGRAEALRRRARRAVPVRRSTSVMEGSVSAGLTCRTRFRDRSGNRARPRWPRPIRSGLNRRAPHRPRRHAEQGEARGKRADGRFAWRSSCGGRKPRLAALALLPWRQAGDHSAARDPDFWRRRPCRTANRRARFHGHGATRQDFCRGARGHGGSLLCRGQDHG